MSNIFLDRFDDFLLQCKMVMQETNPSSELVSYFEHMIKYNVLGGKMLRGNFMLDSESRLKSVLNTGSESAAHNH